MKTQVSDKVLVEIRAADPERIDNDQDLAWTLICRALTNDDLGQLCWLIESKHTNTSGDNQARLCRLLMLRMIEVVQGDDGSPAILPTRSAVRLHMWLLSKQKTT